MRLLVLLAGLCCTTAAAAPAGAATLGLEEEARYEVGSIGKLAADARGRLFAFDESSVVVLDAATGRRLAAWPATPGTLAVSPEGDVYVFDVEAVRVTRYSPEGTVLGTFGEGILDEYDGPIAFDPRGTVLVANSLGAKRFARDGTFLGSGGGVSGDSLAITPRGTMWSAGSGWVRGSRPDGRLVQVIDAALQGQAGDGALSEHTQIVAGTGIEAITADPAHGRFGLHDARGVLRQVCPLTGSGVVSDGAGHLYVRDGPSVVRLAERDRPTPGCRSPTLRVSGLRARGGRWLTVRYTLHGGAKWVAVRIMRDVRVPWARRAPTLLGLRRPHDRRDAPAASRPVPGARAPQHAAASRSLPRSGVRQRRRGGPGVLTARHGAAVVGCRPYGPIRTT